MSDTTLTKTHWPDEHISAPKVCRQRKKLEVKHLKSNYQKELATSKSTTSHHWTIQSQEQIREISPWFDPRNAIVRWHIGDHCYKMQTIMPL